MEELWLTSYTDCSVFLQKQINEKTVYKTTDGHEIIVEACEHIWECDYCTLVTDLYNNNDHSTTLSSSKLLKSIVSKSAYYTPLSARDAFVGGRTENFYLHWTKQDTNKHFC